MPGLPPAGADGMITTTAVNSLGGVPGDRVGAVIVRRVRDSAIAAPGVVLGPERRTELTAAATADLGKPEKARHHLLVAREPSGGHRSHFGLKARLLKRHRPQRLRPNRPGLHRAERRLKRDDIRGSQNFVLAMARRYDGHHRAAVKRY